MRFPLLSAPGRRRSPAKAPRRPPARLAVEALEDRCVPSGNNPLGEFVSSDPNDWPMYNHDVVGTRYNSAESRLTPDNVDDLKVKWTFVTPGAIAGTPVVVNDRIYAADTTGTVHALNRDGSLVWQTLLDVGTTTHPIKVTASALVTNRTVIIGDQSGRVHGLDVDTGDVRWTTSPNPHPFAAIWGSPTMIGNNVVVGVSSNEWFIPAFVPGYQPTFRGSLVLLDPTDGDVLWQTFTITAAENAAGASGAPIWSTPTYDASTNTIYATTGNNYSQPTTGTSDAFMAFDATTGAVKWVNQRTAGDEWTVAFGDSSPQHPDFDIGDSPQIYKLGNRTVISAGQKSGFFHVLDAATGAEVNDPIQLAPPGTVGGLFADSAYANGVVYTNGSDWPAPFTGPPPNKGIISAVAADGSHEVWRFETPFSPNLSGVTAANGVVYFQSALDGMFYALDAASGALLAKVATGGQSSGPAISRGQIYLGTGDSAFPFLDPTLPIGPGSIVALGLDEPAWIEQVVVNDGSAQRSMVTSITVIFSDKVTIEDGAFQLRRQGGPAIDLDVEASVVNGRTVAVLTFQGSDIVGGSLADGNYTLTIRGDRIRDAANRRLDGDGDGDAGGNHRATLHRLYGDSDGDRDVDLSDLLRFFTTLGKEEGQQGYLGYFDHDGDGDVDLRDSLALLQRLGNQLKL